MMARQDISAVLERKETRGDGGNETLAVAERAQALCITMMSARGCLDRGK